MKRSSTIISVIVAAVVILAALAIGLYIKEVRRKYKAGESEAAAELETKQAEITTRPAREGRRRFQNPPAEQRAQLTEQMEDIGQRWATMSEPERKEFRAKMAEISQAVRSERNRRFETSPPEGRDRFAEEFIEIKNRWEDMSEEKRQEYTARMREEPNNVRDAKE